MKKPLVIVAALVLASALAWAAMRQRTAAPPRGDKAAAHWPVALAIDPEAKAKFSDDEARVIWQADELLRKANDQLSRNDNDGAEYKANQVARMTPSRIQAAQAANVLATVCIRRRHFEAAAVCYTTAIEKHPVVASYHFWRGYCKVQLAEESRPRRSNYLAEAEADLKEAVRLDPSHRSEAKRLLPDAFP